ncbi:hypothetical protein GCM10010383_48600 [Streptomyces lomondensis]|uniref:Uncharacterized protein n=2 Tax=Streptomyces lomondensis TaxID=68229 RepID=A0ABQ2XEH2_9ACTN|nr:hypothetical protein GCM10010383_48600 [Streptomyces lomondensis]
MWTGIGLCAAGALGLVVGGVLDVEAADPWASVAGGAAGLVGLALTIHALFSGRGGGTPGASSVTANGARSVAAGGSIGTVATGDGASVPPPASPPAPPAAAPRPAGGSVTASGDRSVAAGGDIGSVSTGDA